MDLNLPLPEDPARETDSSLWLSAFERGLMARFMRMLHSQSLIHPTTICIFVEYGLGSKVKCKGIHEALNKWLQNRVMRTIMKCRSASHGAAGTALHCSRRGVDGSFRNKGILDLGFPRMHRN